MEFLVADGNLPFTTAIVLMLGLGALEAVSLLFGTQLSEAVENFLPALDLDTPEVEAPGSLAQLSGWLRVREVPVMMLLVIFLTAFGLIGISLQALASEIASSLLPGWLASIFAFLLSLPVVRGMGGLVARVLPRDESDAVSEDSFIGRMATITLGRATYGSPAQARVRDVHGHTHYVMVEPDNNEESFESGRQVILVHRQGAVFRAVDSSTPVDGFKSLDY